MSYYSELCGVSESCFRRLFKEYTGQSPIEYRNSIRIANLKRLLSSGEFKINEAAYLVGFNNMSFFYEVYNKYKD
jgi:transcriptional regulator GlxA family with amidase domain